MKATSAINGLSKPVSLLAAVTLLVGVGTALGSESKDPETTKAYKEGQAEARADIKEGRLVVKTYGLPGPSRTPYAEILKEKYGVELRAVAGCVVTSELLENVRGYNEVSQAEIERRFGKGVLKKASDEAAARCRDKRSEEPAD